MLHFKRRRLHNSIYTWVLAFAAASFATLPSRAVEGLSETPAPKHIMIYTQTAAARAASGPAEQLFQKARAQGQVRVIIGLRTTMRMEHTLSPLQVRAQQQSLRRLQDAILARPINVGGFNILRVVSNGSSHSFFLNSTLVCSFSDATYATGQVGIGAFVDSGGHSVAVDYVSVKAIGSGAAPEFDEVMDPGAFLAQADDKASLGGSVARREQPRKAAGMN